MKFERRKKFRYLLSKYGLKGLWKAYASRKEGRIFDKREIEEEITYTKRLVDS